MTNTYTSAELLRDAATHFVAKDWDYTRLHTIRRIRYADDYKGYEAPFRRLGRAIGSLFARRGDYLFGRDRGMRERFLYKWAYFCIQIRTDRHLPDGVLSNGVITHWEEDGEYIQMVQPSVGALVAAFLLEEPDNPHAVAITNELDRIRDRYRLRVKAGEVTGMVSDD